ncbi:uncharacterized protein EAF02_002136 [Botrytis sinoallii]|uniref:uncharacterized protein n=1 Tax=Botrytis sinoallii TaxID=1463999 RepID=UPI00190105AC|nr:uncharacterized protein EAF02_002136 [Botrytis sinoallii]KAF7889721.1 hypothetical protein EAF02_002136 [Botrytis sinoallii]
MIKYRNKAIGAIQIAFHTSLLKRPEFLLTLAWGSLSVLGYVALLFSISTYANTVGLTIFQGSILGATFNLGGGLGRPVIGYASDCFGRIDTRTFWILTKKIGVLNFYALIGGAVSATFITTIAPVGAEVVGLQFLPSALSIFWVSVVIPSTFAEPCTLVANQQWNQFSACPDIHWLYLVRAWKISELQKTDTDDAVNCEAKVRGKNAVPRDPMMIQKVSKVPSVISKAKSAKNLFKIVKV